MTPAAAEDYQPGERVEAALKQAFRTAYDNLFQILTGGGGGGTTAHNLLSATHTDTTTASPTRGDIITAQGASPKWGRLALGSGVVRSDGTDVVWGTAQTADITNDAVTYAKIQNVSATDRLLGRDTAGAGDVEELTASQALDFVGSTRGSVLYRGATGWAILTPGTSGQVLTANGAGADPTYQAGGGGGAWSFVDASRGSSTATTETKFRTTAIPGLTLNDTIRVSLYVETVTQQTANIRVAVPGGGCMTARTITAGQQAMFQITVWPNAVDTTFRSCHIDGTFTTSGNWDEIGGNNSATEWTAAWNLEFIHGGVTSGGTFYWHLQVYKAAGQ